MTDRTALTEADLLDYAVGALPPEAVVVMAARLAKDAAARETLVDWQRQDAAIEALYHPVTHEPVPDRLTDVIRRAQDAEAAQHADQSKARFGLAAATVAALVLGAGGGWFARDITTPTIGAVTLADNAMRAYDTFVVEVRHPVEVTASDADHLTAWLSKRLGHETRPPDFASAGFVLMGGRIVPSEQGAAALYMYENTQGQRVTLYIAPQGASQSTAFQFAEKGTTQTFYWTDRELSYAVVGTVPRDVLRRIALASYDQLI